MDTGPDADTDREPDASLDADDRPDADARPDAGPDGDSGDSGVPRDWWDTAWPRRVRIEVDPARVAGDFERFPLLVVLRGVGELAANRPEDGPSLAFVFEDEDRLPHEVDVFDPDRGALAAWVLVPRLTASDPAVLYLYFGQAADAETVDPTLVWADGYGGVWHFGLGSWGVPDPFGPGPAASTRCACPRSRDRPGGS